MSSIEDVGIVIHVLRVIRKLSQGDLAKRSGVRNSSISNYERGKAVPKFETLQKLAEGMELPLSAVEETQDFIHRMRSLGLGSGEAAPAERWPGAEALLKEPRDPAELQAEVEQISGDAGRLTSRLTRLVLEILATGRAPGGGSPEPPPTEPPA